MAGITNTILVYAVINRNNCVFFLFNSLKIFFCFRMKTIATYPSLHQVHIADRLHMENPLTTTPPPPLISNPPTVL